MFVAIRFVGLIDFVISDTLGDSTPPPWTYTEYVVFCDRPVNLYWVVEIFGIFDCPELGAGIMTIV